MTVKVLQQISVFSFTCNFPFTGRKTSLNNSDNASTYYDPENGNKDRSRRRILKKPSETRKQPSLDKKRKTGQVRMLDVQSPGIVSPIIIVILTT